MKKNAPKPEAEKAEKKGPKQRGTLDKKVQARSFLGKKNLATVDGMPVMYGPNVKKGSGGGQGGAIPTPAIGMSAAALASAALAQRIRPQDDNKDALTEFRDTGQWNSAAIIAAIREQPPLRQGKQPEGLLSAVRALLMAMVYGEKKGVRMLCAALMHSQQLSPEDQRQVDGVSRAAGARQLNMEQIMGLGPLLLGACEGPDIMMRATRLVALCDSPRNLGKRATCTATPQQLLDLKAQEACLVAADLPTREVTGSGRAREFKKAVAVLRNVNGQLIVIDPLGLYDASTGAHDGKVNISELHRSQEISLRDYLAGMRPAPPASPAARLIYGGYDDGIVPEIIVGTEISVLGGFAFHFC